jgi:hemerythrin-like domain-containing protein
MKIIEALLGEHGAFYAQFAHLEQAIPAAEDAAQIREQAALLAAALGSHANLENELLFAALDPHLGPMGPLAVMRMEHDEIESALTGAQEAENVEEARTLLTRVIRVAREHFAKEERVLFPMALQVLDAETLDRLGEQWASRRGVTLS